MNPIRSLMAVLGGIGFVNVMSQLLEAMLIAVAAGGSIDSAAALFAVRSRPGVLAGKLASDALVALLGGYLAARIAGRRELVHAGVAALVVTAALVRGLTIGEAAASTPVWMRIALVAVTGTAMLAGASIRARAVRSQT